MVIINELATIFGIKETEAITEDNWRKFTGKKKVNWKSYKVKEFEQLVTTLVDRAHDFKWSAWVGGTANEYSITLYCSGKQENAYIHKNIGMTLTRFMELQQKRRRTLPNVFQEEMKSMKRL